MQKTDGQDMVQVFGDRTNTQNTLTMKKLDNKLNRQQNHFVKN